MALLATLWTTPWDNLMLYEGVWSYPPDAVLGRLFLVPIEEHLFFLVQPILTGLLIALGLKGERAPQERDKAIRVTGVALILGSFFWAVNHLDGHFYYLAVTVAWFAPVFALQWWIGGDLLAARAGRLVPIWAISTLYLSLVDGVAMSAHVWSISAAHTTGLHVGNVPIEEIAFFGITNLLVIGGLVLFVDLKEGRLWSSN